MDEAGSGYLALFLALEVPKLKAVGSLLHGTYILSDHVSEQEKEEAI